MKLFRTILLLALAFIVPAQICQHHYFAAAIFTFVGLASLTSWQHYSPLSFGENDFGALADSTLIHDLMSDFRMDLDPLLNLTLDIGDQQSDGGIVRTLRPGQTVTFTNYFTYNDPYDVNAAGGYVAQDYTKGAPVQITMPNNPWAVSAKITPAEFRILTGGPRVGAAYDSLRRKLNEGMFYSLKKKIVTDFFALITAGNYTTNFVSASGTFSRAQEIDLDSKLFGRNLDALPSAQVILPPAPFGEWAKDHIILNSYTGAVQKDRLMGGGVPSQVSQFTFWRTNVSMPADAARGFAYMKKAAAFISRIPDEPGLGTGATPASGSDQFNSLATVVDTKSGIAFLVRTFKNWNTGHLQMDVAIIYKFGVFQPEFLERMTAT